jgi:hypothetical protein
MIVKSQVTLLGVEPQRTHRINANSFQQDAITTFKGWQYAAFFTTDNGDSQNVGLVCLSRRQVPSSQEDDDMKPDAWEKIIFNDYKQTVDDGHNTISIGICHGDGTIHLSFDHHCDR